MAPNITFGGSGGNPPLDMNWGNKYGGNNVTYRPGGGNKVALAGGGFLGQWGLNAAMDDLGKKVGPYGTALKETVLGEGGKVGKSLPGQAKGLSKSIAQNIAPKAYAEAVQRGNQAYQQTMNAARAAAGTTSIPLKGGSVLIRGGLTGKALTNAKTAANIARIKPGLQIAGRWAGNRVPFLGAGLDLAAGDPLGAAGTLAGGAIGGALTLGNPLGIAVGSMVGGPVIKGVRNTVGRAFGLGTAGDPLSGSENAVLFGIPLSPYAKTVRDQKKRLDLYEKGEGALLQKANEQQMEREMKLMQLGMLQSQMQSGAAAISQIMANNPYT